MHDALYAARGALGLDAVLAAARSVGLDVERVRAELADGAHAARVEEDVAERPRRGRVAGRRRSSSTASATTAATTLSR